MASVRFGVFEFDPATHELRREGAPVRLQGQPAQVLAMLLSRPGEVVTREALQQAVWGQETFVDFDRGLNFCIAQIRSALKDSAESPRFIQTIPKRGYRFIAPAAHVEAAVAEPPVITRKQFAKPRTLAAGILALAVGAGVLTWLQPWRAPAQPLNVAVTRFDNETGNAEFDRFADAVTDSVVAELTGSGAGRYGTIGNAAVLRKPRDQRDLVAIGTALQARYVILGQVQRNGSAISVLAHLIRLPQQTHVKVARIECKADETAGTEAVLAKRIVADLSPRITRERNPSNPTLHPAVSN